MKKKKCSWEINKFYLVMVLYQRSSVAIARYGVFFIRSVLLDLLFFHHHGRLNFPNFGFVVSPGYGFISGGGEEGGG